MAENEFAIVKIDAGELSKPANTLLKRICGALGGAVEPWQIRRLAQANADAAIITAKADLEIQQLQHRTLQRLMAEEMRYQQNIEQITEKAIPLVAEDARVEELSNDWIADFFQKCRLISDAEMQDFWARILAGEANNPGKFRLRTLALLKSADKEEAQAFQSLCRLASTHASSNTPLLTVFDHNHASIKSCGLSFSVLQHLDVIGLIKFSPGMNYKLHINEPEVTIRHHGQSLRIVGTKSEEANWEIPLGHIVFTSMGEELASIISAEPLDGYLEYIKEMYIGNKNLASEI